MSPPPGNGQGLAFEVRMTIPSDETAAAVPVLVLSRLQEGSEAINSILRNAGHAVHCTWLPSAGDLADAMIQINPELLVLFADDGLIDLAILPSLRAHSSPPVPIVLISEDTSEQAITAALAAGAQDRVSAAARERIRFVCERELRGFRLERALKRTLSAAQESQQALQVFLDGSADAVVEVQEGIVVGANPSWLELLGYPNLEAVAGQPLMDFFEHESHSSVRGALGACLQGKWADHTLRAGALLADGSTLSLDFHLARTEFDGDPAVRFVVAAQRGGDEKQFEQRLQEAVQVEQGTGFLHRRFLIDKLRDRLKNPVRAGARFVAIVRLDRIDQLISQVGPLAVEDLVVQFAHLLREQLQGDDLAGRFTGSSFLCLLERGNARDVEAWGEHVLRKAAAHVFKVDDKSITATATVGLGLVPPSAADPSAAVADAHEAARKGVEQGGNQIYSLERADNDKRVEAYDKIWVRHIKAALMDNRFRLVQLPIASLLGEDKSMYDVLVRMLDEQGREVLPSEFIPAAERNDLMKNIDRWVIGASMAFCAARKPDAVFVRLARDSVTDRSLPIWLGNQLKAAKIEPRRVCFQVSEDVVANYLLQSKDMRTAIGSQGFAFAIERFGAGADAQKVVEHLRPDYVKIDGSLMQGITHDAPLQQRVRVLVELAKGVGAATIADRVEDANTMAVMWQLGIGFVQGYFVHKPEAVTLG